MANAIAPALAVPADVQNQALDLLDLCVEILERAESARRLHDQVEAAMLALADSGLPPLPPSLDDPQAVRLWSWSATAGFSAARDAMYAACCLLDPQASRHEIDPDAAPEEAARALAEARRFLAQAGR